MEGKEIQNEKEYTPRESSKAKLFVPRRSLSKKENTGLDTGTDRKSHGPAFY